MDERSGRRAPASQGPAEAAWALAIAGLVAGLAIGASGPLFVVVASPFLAGGPTWGGLALVGGVLVALAAGLAAMFTRHGRWGTVPAFAFGATLAAGIVAGTRLGPALGMGG